MRTTGFVALTPGNTRTLFSSGGVSLVAVCNAGPTTVLNISPTGPFLVYSTQSTSLGNLGAALFAGSSVAIASSNAGVDGGRFNLAGSGGVALNGTFLSYSGTGNTCNYEATAISDSGASGSSLTARSARTIVPIASSGARGRKSR